jgi:copper chaperone
MAPVGMERAKVAREGAEEMMNTKQARFDVLGMSCPSCVRHINVALSDVEGVQKVDVQLRDGKVLVQYDPSVVDVVALIEALRDAGYESTPDVAA